MTTDEAKDEVLRFADLREILDALERVRNGGPYHRPLDAALRRLQRPRPDWGIGFAKLPRAQ